MKIAFNRPATAGREFEYMAQAVTAGHLSGDGAFTRRSQGLLSEITGAGRALLTSSCTHALDMAALLLDCRPGDEVIVPSFTFVSTINAFALRGVRPVFADIRPDTLNIDEAQLEGLCTPRTRAIVIVHYAGVACEMDAIMAIAARRGIAVIEDNAHGLFGSYRGRPLGSFGCLATLSFHETKNLTSGEGGALLINDERFFDRAEILREKGTNRSRFFRGQVDKYTWVDLGSSFLMSDMNAAFLWAQLEQRQAIQAARQRIWDYYYQNLGPWAAQHGVGLPVVPPHCEQPAHLFYLLLPGAQDRTALIAHLAARDVSSVFHYVPLHLSPMGRHFGGRPGLCPVTERTSDRLLRLPLHTSLTRADLDWVVEALCGFTPAHNVALLP